MNIVQELSCNGVAPTGPVSAWPRDRHEALMTGFSLHAPPGTTTSYTIGSKGDVDLNMHSSVEHATKVSVGLGAMAKGLAKVAGQAITHGKVSEEVRNERYDTCKNCPFFIEESKRCSECGCFMEAKTWIGGNPNMLCPKQKWSR